tara:strand:+ start:234 stop:1361 length:1128 start_codon:yes stop_codon:yes gene_type:complete
MSESKQEFRPRVPIKLKEHFDKWMSHHKALRYECEEVGIPINKVKQYWHKGKNFSIMVKGDSADTDITQLMDDHLKKIKAMSPFKPKITKKYKGGHCLIIDPADVHIGKLAIKAETGDDYNSEIAIERMKQGVMELYNRASATANIEQIIFVGGNDMLHTDTTDGKTTAGTSQDTCGMWWENYTLAWMTCAELITALSEKCKVHYIHCPSNHDWESGFHLAQNVAAYLWNNKNVTTDVTNAHRKYVNYGRCLFGFTHGDGAKETQLPSLMADEAKSAWATADHKHIYCHHLHHKIKNAYQKGVKMNIEKEHSDVTVIQCKTNGCDEDRVNVEYLRSPSGTDSWHSRNGYSGGKKAIEAFIFDPVLGERARLVEFF